MVKRLSPVQHVRRLKSGKRVIVNKGERRRQIRSTIDDDLRILQLRSQIRFAEEFKKRSKKTPRARLNFGMGLFESEDEPRKIRKKIESLKDQREEITGQLSDTGGSISGSDQVRLARLSEIEGEITGIEGTLDELQLFDKTKKKIKGRFSRGLEF